MLTKITSFLFCSSLLFFSVAIPSWANYSFTPIVQQFSPKGTDATHFFHLYNPSNTPIALQCTLAKRDVDENGMEILDEEAAEDLFLIYPSQIILPPNKTQVLRVSWLGENELKRELAYRLLCKQLPIDLAKLSKNKNIDTPSKEKREVRLLFNYSAAIYITPEGVAPNLYLETAKNIKDEDGNPLLELVFNNEGTEHKILRDIVLTISSEGAKNKNVTLTTSDFQGGLNILSGKKKRFIFPWPEELPFGSPNVEYDFFGKGESRL